MALQIQYNPLIRFNLDISDVFPVPPGDLHSISDTADTKVNPDAYNNIKLEGIAGVTITANALTNKLTIAASGGALTWSTVAGTTQAMGVHNGYVTSNVGLTTFTLPAAAALGDNVIIEGLGSGGWRLAQNAGQHIFYGRKETTTGVGGYIDSLNRYDTVVLRCIVANTTWKAVSTDLLNVT